MVIGTSPQDQAKDRRTMGSTALDFKSLLKKEREQQQAALRKATTSNQSFPPFSSREPLPLDDYYNAGRSQSGLESVAYIPNFLTKEEGRRLLLAIDQV